MGAARARGASTLLASIAIALPALGAHGCSSSSSSPDDAGVVEHRDVGVDDASGDDAPMDSTKAADGAETGATFDGTTGKPCTTDADCRGAANINDCSTDAFTAALYPTPVCLTTLPCSVPDSMVHFCDGPDDPSSPGICVPQSALPKGEGLCLPKCTFDDAGGAPQGCQGKDACYYFGWTKSAAGFQGFGACIGGCTKDSDCPAAQKCQVDTGYCEKSPTPPTLPLGAGCGSTTAACDCWFVASSGAGFCTQTCVVGGNGCPSGWVCDSTEPASEFSQVNDGLWGFCIPACSLDGGTPDAAAVDAGACPPNSSCQSLYAVGPDCQP